MLYESRYETPLGTVTAVSGEDRLLGLWLAGQKGPQLREAPVPGEPEVLRQTGLWLEAYFAGEAPDPFRIPVELHGTAFQLRVWNLLRQIPYGTTTTYGALARQLAAPGGKMSAQAVGGAVGKNPVSILIPCHRVLGAGGALTGYAGGIRCKEWLLRHEGVAL